MQSHNVNIWLRVYAINYAERYPVVRAGPLARVLHQDIAHYPRGKTKKLSTVMKTSFLLVDEPKICVVNQNRRLYRAVLPFAAKIPSGQPPKLGVYQWH